MTELERTETESPEQTEAFGGYLAEKYPEKRVIALLGGLGAGKTALTRGIARRLGCLDQASSPTYAIVNEYRGPRPVCHFDMYRIQERKYFGGSATGYAFCETGDSIAGKKAHYCDRRGDIMLILALDTAWRTASAALCQNGKILAYRERE